MKIIVELYDGPIYDEKTEVIETLRYRDVIGYPVIDLTDSEYLHEVGFTETPDPNGEYYEVLFLNNRLLFPFSTTRILSL